MTARERVLAAVHHRQPDRVPVDFGGHRSSGIAAAAYARLKKHLGIAQGDLYVYDMVQQLAIVEPAVLAAVGADVVELGRGFMLDEKDWKPWTLPDGTPCKIPAFIRVEKQGADSFLLSPDGVRLAIQKQGCLYFEQIHFPLLERPFEEERFADIEDAFAHTMWTGIPAPGGQMPLTADGLRQLAAGAKALRAGTDRAILGIFGGNLFEVPQFLYRNDRYFEYMGLYPEACVRLSEKLASLYLAKMEKWLGAVGPFIDIMLFGDDLGGQNGPLLSPGMYREYFKPFHAKMWKRAKELAPHIKIQLHCCGGIEPLLGDLMEAGLDMINPVQITCAGMDAQRLKEKYGRGLTFWGGGCDTRHVLPRGTPAQVREHVLRQAEILSPGGGFVFQQVHNVMADVPPENIMAMFGAIAEFGNR
ncbi:MAG: methyltransferase [Kiritimatiellaeota bacterium]|nr:methyltransferase [Kiritimatiellota bacterium]